MLYPPKEIFPHTLDRRWPSVKQKKLFSSIYDIFFYTQPVFVLRLLLDFCIVHDHIIVFFLFLLYKDFNIFPELFLYFFFIIYTLHIFIYLKKKKEKKKVLLKITRILKRFLGNITDFYFFKKIINFFHNI